jgi:hypothetical protein
LIAYVVDLLRSEGFGADTIIFSICRAHNHTTGKCSIIRHVDIKTAVTRKQACLLLYRKVVGFRL